MQIDLPPSVINAPKPQPQAQPQEQPRDSSSSEINIIPMDLDNPYIRRSIEAYGVE